MATVWPAPDEEDIHYPKIPHGTLEIKNEPLQSGNEKGDQTAEKGKNSEEPETEALSPVMRFVEKVQQKLAAFFEQRKRHFKIAFYVLLVLAYHGYFAAALWHDYRRAVALIVFTAIGWWYVFYTFVYLPYVSKKAEEILWNRLNVAIARAWSFNIAKWCVYGALVSAIVLFLAIDTKSNRYRLVSLAGLFTYLFLSFIFSTNPARVRWRPILWGLGLQLVLGLLVLRWPPGIAAFQWAADQIVRFLEYTNVGTEFVYGFLSHPPKICGMNPVLYFTVFQVLIYFGSVVAVLYYYGVIQWFVIRMAKVMQYTIGTTATESLYSASCIFLGMSEAGLIIRPYMPKLTMSELHQLMASGFACIAGSLFAAYVSFGACPVYLLSASIMSCPASLVASKLLYPETEKSQTKDVGDLHLPKGTERNVLEAISNGACSVIEIVFSIAANLIVYLALMAFLNNVVGWLGEMVGIEGLTFEVIYSYIFFPLAFIMGASDSTDWDRKVSETMAVAELIGTKTILNEFIAYQKMGEFALAGRISGRAQMITTYALCGFSNIGSIGIQIGCLGVMCPEKKHIFPQIAVRALVAGSVSCFITACFAGLLVSEPLACKPARFNDHCFNVTMH